jgi:Cobalamin synthesis G C-terminus
VAQINKAIRAGHGFNADLIPADILKSIDQAELLDRLVHVTELVRKSRAAGDPVLRKGYSTLAKAVLTAQPRARTEAQVADRIAKAAGLGHTGQADALRREAQDLLERHPTAPRRADAAAVAKAKADEPDMVAVFDAGGNLIGICPRAKLQPVTGADAPKPPSSAADAAGTDQVAKAALAGWRAAGRRQAATSRPRRA